MGVRFRTANVLVKVTRLEDFDGHIKLRLRTWTRISGRSTAIMPLPSFEIFCCGVGLSRAPLRFGPPASGKPFLSLTETAFAPSAGVNIQNRTTHVAGFPGLPDSRSAGLPASLLLLKQPRQQVGLLIRPRPAIVFNTRIFCVTRKPTSGLNRVNHHA
jgi:hypothetical protein